LITGAASGIGQAMAKVFSGLGSSLFLLDIDKIGLGQTVDLIKGSDCEVDSYVVDLANKKEIDDFWQKIVDNPPSVLVNNAGIYPFQDFLLLTEEKLKWVLNVNLNSAVWMCQNFIKSRNKKGGVIINISSVEAILPFKEDLIPYCISKSGVISLTRSIARDYGRHGFRANVILPGAIKTPGTEFLIKSAVNKLKLKLLRTGYNFNERIALGRWGKPDEVAKVAVFLASDMSSYVQGSVIPVDGGFLSS